MQVVRDTPNPVRLIYIGRGLAKAEVLGPDEVAAKYRVPAERAGPAYAEMAMLRGDPSDGLPGVPGIGDKSAAAIVSKFDSWAQLLDAVVDPSDGRISPPVRIKLQAAKDYLAVVEPVVRVAVDAQGADGPGRRIADQTRRPGPGRRAARAVGAVRAGRPADRRAGRLTGAAPRARAQLRSAHLVVAVRRRYLIWTVRRLPVHGRGTRERLTDLDLHVRRALDVPHALDLVVGAEHLLHAGLHGGRVEHPGHEEAPG